MLQAVNGHQESFVVFKHAGGLAFLDAFGQQGQDDGCLHRGIFFIFLVTFLE